jgi:hypothetical protein
MSIIIFDYIIFPIIFLFYDFFQPILGTMAYNVPAVYDVLTARIRALQSKDQGWQNVPEQRRGNGA